MKRVVCLLRVTLGMLFLTPPVGATDGKYRQLSSDQTQASYQRKSITYLGMDCGSGVDVDLPVKQAIESALRRHIEIARFDYNEVKGTGAMSMEQLARQLRDYVKQRAVQRAASEAEYDPRFKSARVYSFDVERVMKSAYLYTVRLTLFRAGKYTCPGNVLLAAANACVPGEAGMKVKLNATVTFYHLNLDNDSQPAWTVVKELRADPAEAFFAYPTAPTSSGRQAREESRRELEEYKKALSDMDGYTTARAASKAADELGRWLAKEMKKLPAFQLPPSLLAVLPAGRSWCRGIGEESLRWIDAQLFHHRPGGL